MLPQCVHCAHTLVHCTHTLVHCTHTLVHCTHTLVHCTHTLVLHTTHHCTLYPAHHCALYTIAPCTQSHPTLNSQVRAKAEAEAIGQKGSPCSIFGSSDGAAGMGVGGRREGAWERAAVHSAAATWGRALDKGQHEHITHPPTPSFSQVNGYMTAVDARRVIRGTALQEEASARRGCYWAALEASYSPIGGR